MIFGWIFIVFGILGFIPNPFIGDGAFLHFDIVGNIFHIVLGIIAIAMAKKGEEGSVSFLKWVGIVLAILAIIGFFQVGSSGVGKLIGIMEINGIVNWFYIILAIIFIAVGFGGGRKGGSMPMGDNTGGPVGGGDMKDHQM